MRADRVEVSWDPGKSNWLVRVETGEEVIRRHANAPKSADQTALEAAARSILKDEGYEPDGVEIRVVR